MKIAIVTDSTADIPVEIIKRNNIHVVPNRVIIDGKDYADGIDITRQEFYERLPLMESPPTTATASSGTYQNLFAELFDQGIQHIISIHVSKKFSGVFNAASTGAQSFNDRMHVIDSEQVTLGLGYQVIAAAEAAMRGSSLEAVLERINNVRRRVRVIAMLDTLEYLHKSGRVSWARARIGNLLRVKPFIDVIGGHAKRIGDVRTRRRGIKRLLRLLNDLGDLEQLAVLHTNAEADAHHFSQEYQGKLDTEAMVIYVTTAIGTHVGPNGLGFVAVQK
jgi:DegV family protein with EDD domain